MDVVLNYLEIKKNLPSEVVLVAVSKFQPSSAIRKLYDAGCRDFGESRVQELIVKKNELPSDIRWHFIGHLQSNKVREIVPFVYLIHGVDSLKLLSVINAEVAKCNRTVNCLLQAHIAKESTKFGFSPDEIVSIANSYASTFTNIAICGLMGMATNTENTQIVASEFAEIKVLFDEMKQIKKQTNSFTILSIGMSGDYSLAVSSGSTMVRVGSSIFGDR